MKSLLPLLLIVAGPALAATREPLPPQARIPFVNHGGIYDWQAVDRNTIFIEDRSRHWFRADLFAPCLDIDFAQRVGFIAGPDDVFDRFSHVLVGRERCDVQSLTPSGPPPRRGKHHGS